MQFCEHSVISSNSTPNILLSLMFLLSGLLKASVATTVMVSRPVQTEVVRKFTGSTGIGIYPSATAVSCYVLPGHEENAGQRIHIYDITQPYWK